MLISKVILYVILGLPIIVFLTTILVVGLRKKQMPSGWLSVATSALVIILFIFCLFDTGHINRFVVHSADDTYYISSNALEEVILKNIDNLGMALSRVYEKFYIKETFDCSEESESVKYVEKDGDIYLKLKLKYQPVLNSIQWFFSGGWKYWPVLTDESYFVDEDLFLWSKSVDTNSIDELRERAKRDNIVAELRYLRKE